MRRLAFIVSLIALLGLTACDLRPTTNEFRLDRIAAELDYRNPEPTVTKLETYIQDYPADPTAWVILGNLREKAEKYDLARGCYQQALVLQPDMVEALTGMGIIARSTGDSEAAVGWYEKALAVDPAYAQAWSSLLVIHLLEGNHAAALEAGEKAWAFDREDASIPANLAVAYHVSGNAERAATFLAHAERMDYHRKDELRSLITAAE